MASNDPDPPDLSTDPQPGDLIEIFRPAYQHWALYLGDGYIINLTPVGQCQVNLWKASKCWLSDITGCFEWKMHEINRKLN